MAQTNKKAAKITTVAEIAEGFRSSSATVVTEYRGLKMAQLTTLRRALGNDTSYTVAKNTLVKRAAAEAGVTGLDEMFTGPTAVAFIAGEPVDAAKALRDFAKTNPLLVIKGGLLDGKSLTAAEVTKLADLESREVLLGKLAGAMLGTLTKAAVVLNALPSKMAQLAAALYEKNAADAPAEAEVADSVPVDSVPVDSVPVDSVPVDSVPAASVPVDSAPADSVPTASAPVASAAADAAPADIAPADIAPADIAPAEIIDPARPSDVPTQDQTDSV